MLLLRPRERFEVAPAEPRAYFSAADLEKAKRFRTGQLRLFGARTALDLALLGLSVARPPRAGSRPVLTGAATAAGMSLVSTVAGLPLRAAARQRAKDVGLVTQSWGGWAADLAKTTALGGAFAAAGGAALTAGMRRFGRHWWAPGAGVTSGVSLALVFLSPVALDPLFNKFTPLPDGDARRDVLDLAGRAGIDVGEVYEVDASRRTTAANAYVTGLGRTKRVVLFDTLIKDFTPAETRLVIAHELGHVRHRDVPKGLLWAAAISPLAMLTVAGAAERLARPDKTPVPAVTLALSLVVPALSTISNQLSRAIERRADGFALTLTSEPEAMVAMEQRLTLKNVGDPLPPRWQQILLGTHPPTMERIGQALAFQR